MLDGEVEVKRILIIGGGVAGLGAAYKVTRAASEGHEVDFVLFEKDPRLGGKIQTEIVRDASEDKFIVDGGPDCFLTEKPACHRIAKLLGIFDDELPTDESRKRTWILSRGKLHQMPDGIFMFAPTKFLPFATTGLFSWPGKIRMAMDLFIPPKKVVPGELNDETLESFVVRRMGRECLERLAEPLVGGVHASESSKMSLAATFPRLLEMEQTYGSLTKGFLAARRKVEEMRRKYPPQPGQKPRTFFTSFVNGMQELTDRMADAAGREKMRTGVAVTALRHAHGRAWTVLLSDGSTVDGDAVIIATESWAAEPLVRPHDEVISRCACQHPRFFLGDSLDRFQRERGGLRSECLRGSLSHGRAPCAHGSHVFFHQVAGTSASGQGVVARFRRRPPQPGDRETLGRGACADGPRRVS